MAEPLAAEATVETRLQVGEGELADVVIDFLLRLGLLTTDVRDRSVGLAELLEEVDSWL